MSGQNSCDSEKAAADNPPLSTTPTAPGWPKRTYEPASHRASVFRTAAITGVLVAFVAFAAATFESIPRKYRNPLWLPSAAATLLIVNECTLEVSKSPAPEVAKVCFNGALFFGTFFVFYFLMGFLVVVSAAAIRRKVRKKTEEPK
jgi:hypothetical protein